jgi:putative NADH-flavin reductase
MNSNATFRKPKENTMKVALIGATGKSGLRLQAELLRRGHQVTAVVRSPEKVKAQPGVTTAKSDLSDAEQIAQALKGADAVVSAYGPPADDTDQLMGVTKRIVEAANKNGQRVLVVGGAANLFVAPGVTLLASGYLPESYLPISRSHAAVLENLGKSDADWTYFSPAAFFEPGERTGKFRLGKDDLVADASGTSRISLEDYAVAAVNELEKPAHRGERFTIGY